jgi:hypothetical protein
MVTEKQSFFEETQDLLESYAANRLRLFKLQTAEKSSRVVTLVFTGLVIGLLSFFILLFVSIMAGLYFSEKWHSSFYGFGVVVLFYILLLVAALVMRGTLDKYIFSKVINILFESNSEDDEKQ